MQGDPNGFLVHHLNHSATTTTQLREATNHIITIIRICTYNTARLIKGVKISTIPNICPSMYHILSGDTAIIFLHSDIASGCTTIT